MPTRFHLPRKNLKGKQQYYRGISSAEIFENQENLFKCSTISATISANLTITWRFTVLKKLLFHITN